MEGELTHVLEGHTREVLCLDVKKEAAFSGIIIMSLTTMILMKMKMMPHQRCPRSWSKGGNFSDDHDDNYNVISRDLHKMVIRGP